MLASLLAKTQLFCSFTANCCMINPRFNGLFWFQPKHFFCFAMKGVSMEFYRYFPILLLLIKAICETNRPDMTASVHAENAHSPAGREVDYNPSRLYTTAGDTIFSIVSFLNTH